MVDVAVLFALSVDSISRLYVVLAFKPMRLNECARDSVVFCMYNVSGVLVPYHSFPVASSFVFHETVAVVLAIAEPVIPEMTGAVVSAIAGVTKLCSDEVAVFPTESADFTT